MSTPLEYIKARSVAIGRRADYIEMDRYWKEACGTRRDQAQNVEGIMPIDGKVEESVVQEIGEVREDVLFTRGVVAVFRALLSGFYARGSIMYDAVSK